MILRKPYAFLIKNFRKIHILLFLITCFTIFQTYGLISFTSNYASTLNYNPSISSISQFANGPIYLAMASIIIVSGILIYLLYYKSKPVIAYFLVILEYTALIIFLFVLSNYFTGLQAGGDSSQTALLFRDFTVILTVPQYICALMFLMRGVGLDLKKFGFNEDKDIIASEEDSEEVEVSLEFDKNEFFRKIKTAFRHLSYFVKENKKILISICSIILIFGLYQLYVFVFVTNRVYKEGEEFYANSYKFKINDVYFTDRDYNGDLINLTNKYIIVSLNITNETKSILKFDYEKLTLKTDHNRYIPTLGKYEYFKDMGKGYNNDYLEPKVEYNYLLVYEIKTEDLGSNYHLYYQEIQSRNDVFARKIKISTKDLTNYEESGKASLNEELSIPFYDNTETKLTIRRYSLVDEALLYYEGCATATSCGVYTRTLTPTTNNKILYMNMLSNDTQPLRTSVIVARHGKISYTVNGVEKEIKLQPAINTNYRGNYLYMLVPSDVEKATSINLKFIVRDKMYIYELKKGTEENES